MVQTQLSRGIMFVASTRFDRVETTNVINAYHELSQVVRMIPEASYTVVEPHDQTEL